ncbi:MAG: PAS domain S-box protein [Thermodesulfobacteriota bacterium]
MGKQDNTADTPLQVDLERARRRIAELESALASCVRGDFSFQVLDAVPTPIFVKDEDRRWVYLNRAFLDAAGVPREEVLGRLDSDLFPQEQADVCRAMDDRVLATGEINVNEEDLTFRGRVRLVQVVKSRFVDPGSGRRYIVGYLTDITERRELEEVLRRAERDHRNILDSVNAMIWHMDTGGRVMRANRQAAALCGTTVQAMLGKTVRDLFPPEYAAAYDRDIQEVLATRRPKLGVIEPGPHPDGGTGWFKTDKIPYLDREGEMVGMTIMVEDITPHKRMQDDLRASEERFRALVETTSDCIFEYDAEFRFTYNSPASVQIIGFTPEELAGTSPADLSAPEEVARIMSEYGPDLEARRPYHSLLQRCLHKDGREVLVEVSATPIFDAAGRFAGYRGITRDVTARERAAEALRASEERFRALVETTSDCIWAHDSELRFTYMSPQCLDILGYSPEEMLGMTPLDVTVPEEVSALLEEFGPVLARREPFRGVVQHCLGRDGRVVALESSGSPVFDSAGRFVGYHGVSRDVTAREGAAAALRESEGRLRMLVENIPVLIHAHDENGNYVFWNRESERVLGYSAQEVKAASHIRETLCPDPEYKGILAECHGSKREYRDIEIPLVCKDGARKIISWSSLSETFPLPGWSMWETGVDVTEAREAQERLRQSYADLERRVAERTAELARAEARYRSIYENAPVGIFQKTLQGRFLAANAQLARIYGYDTPEELMAGAAEAPASLYVDPAAWAAMRRLLQNQDRLENFEVLVRRADGQLAWTSRMVRVVRDAEGKAVFYEGFVSDVTLRRQAQERVHSLTRELLRAQESERRRISRELHDNMAQTLSSLAIAWKTMFDDHPEAPAGMRQRAEGLVTHLSGLIRSVRDLAYDLRPLALDELGLARAVRSHCEEFADQTGLKVEFSAAGLDGLRLDTDTSINIFRLVQEALRNVAKHAGADRVGVKLVASHPHILVRVEDDGQGFDMAERRAVTRPGERRMGLQGMEERVLLLGGTFRIHSRPGQGTRIFAEIPVLELVGR